MEKEALGKNIREARIKMGFTQSYLAERANTSEVYISAIERGIKMPSLKVFIKIIEALDLSADYVLRDKLSSGKVYVYDELTERLKNLTPKQRKTAADILDGYLRNL